ncbi:hypothetical protein IEU95_08705 [Hoyosella rhizosphaerae]|nr:hypothetical protein [Hoyosella rhizosphaerae]MBN4926909.1 hypothetical protein [Hoyosella rhizosphaerae]
MNRWWRGCIGVAILMVTAVGCGSDHGSEQRGFENDERENMVASWRETASQQTVDDLDKLAGVAFDVAEDHLAQYGEFYPVAVALLEGNQGALIAPDMETEFPETEAVLAELYKAIEAGADDYLAVAVLVNVRIPSTDSDAVEFQVEHNDGTAIRVVAEYALGEDNAVEFREPSVSNSQPRIWG